MGLGALVLGSSRQQEAQHEERIERRHSTRRESRGGDFTDHLGVVALEHRGLRLRRQRVLRRDQVAVHAPRMVGVVY